MERASKRPSVCLNMIVKNEANVIARCLESVKPVVSAWVIVDTGSTDGTQDVVRECMAGIPGELHERPWVDFAHNRNEAIDLARGKADYAFVIDADDLLVVPPGFTMPALKAAGYQIKVLYDDTSYLRTHLFRSDGDFRYVGVLHEALVSPSGAATPLLPGLLYRCAGGGARSADPEKFRKDAAVLERALATEPGNTRYTFYLAQSWRDAGDHVKAAAFYAKRATMGGWDEEVWCSLLEYAKAIERVGHDEDAVVGAYLRAYESRPTRAEPLYEVSRYLREHGRPIGAYPFARAASEIPLPSDLLFVDQAVYSWRAVDELAVSAYWAGHVREATAANQRLLSGKALPDSQRERVHKNLAFCREKARK